MCLNFGLPAVPLMSTVFLSDVLPKCLYKPTYRKKGQTVGRYKGLYHVRIYFALIFFMLSVYYNWLSELIIFPECVPCYIHINQHVFL